MNDELVELHAVIEPRWWFTPYLLALQFFCELMDDEVKPEHLRWIVDKGVRVTLVGVEP